MKIVVNNKFKEHITFEEYLKKIDQEQEEIHEIMDSILRQFGVTVNLLSKP